MGNQNNYEGRRSVATSSTSSFEYEHQHSSKKHNSKDEKFNNQGETTHIIDGSLDASYMRSLQIGALLALCYNLFSSHFRLRVLQSQKPICNVNKSRRQLPTSELQQNGLSKHKECFIEGNWRGCYPRERRNGSSTTQWQLFFPKTQLSIQPTIFESVLPCSSILSNKKSALAIPSVSLNHPRTYSSYNLPSRQIQDYGRNSF